jgi:hypothetical protein
MRRTRLGILAARPLLDPDCPVPARVARVLADELGWEKGRVSEEVDAFRDETEFEHPRPREGAAVPAP